MSRIRKVRKDDGTLLPFRERKVADTILLGLKASGHADRALADELAGVVSIFLDRYHAEEVPSLGDVREMLGRVLRETGHASAATALSELWLRRARLAAELIVRGASPACGAGVPVDLAVTAEAWNPDRLTSYLRDRRELPEAVAEEVLGSIENRLAACGFESISATFVTEMIDHDLFHRGLEGEGADPVWGVRASELHRRIEEQGASGLAAAVAAPLLERYACSALFSSGPVRAHGDGLLHIHGLDDPLKVESARVPAALLAPEGPGRDVGGWLLDVRVALDAIRPQIRGEILFPDLVATLAGPAAAGDPAEAIRLLLRALDLRDAYGRGREPRIHLEVPLAAASGPESEVRERVVAALLDRLHAPGGVAGSLAISFSLPEPGQPLLPGVIVDRALDLAVDRAATWLRLRDVTGGEASGGTEGGPTALRLSLGRIAFNVPRALGDARSGDMGEVLALLRNAVAPAVTAFHERFWFQRQERAEGLHGLVVGLGGPRAVQVPADGQAVDFEIWGLGYALELLLRRGLFARSRVPDMAAKILSCLDYALGEERSGVSFRVRLGGERDMVVRRRLFDAVQVWAGRYGVEDLATLLAEDRPDATTIPVMLPLLSPRNAPLLGAPLAERLGPGFAIPRPALGDGPLIEGLRALQSGTRLGLLELCPRGPTGEVFEIQEELFG